MTLQPSSSSGLLSPVHRSFKQLTLKAKFFLGSLFYLTYAPYAYQYSYKRDRAERYFLPPTDPEPPQQPGKVVRVESTPVGARIGFEQAELEMTFIQPDLVRMTWQPGVCPVPYALAPNSTQGEPGEITLQESGQGWSLASRALRLELDLEGNLKIYDRAGQLVREEHCPQRTGEGWSHEAVLRSEEQVYGLGERAARLNLRSPVNQEVTDPPTYRLWNYDAAGMYGPGSDPMYISIPIYMGLHQQGCYLVFYENSFEGTVTFSTSAVASFSGGALRYYLAVGTPAQVMERYGDLTGRPPLPPQWALGFHQSRWGYRTEHAVRETVQEFRDRDLPLSAIHLDIDVQVGFRAFTIDPRRFPQLGDFTQELASEGVRFITILNPGVKYSTRSKLYLEGQMLGAFCKYPTGDLVKAPVWCGWSVFPDFTHPLVRQWWSRQYEFMLDLGVAGFWHDMNEPAAFIAWGDRSIPKVAQHYMEGRGGDHREAHNVYGLLQARAGYESLCQYRSHQRPFIVSRAGWAGLQRYAWTWTGDIMCTWECMYQTIATVIGLGLSGIPYSGPDIGGFQGNPSAELYVRWFQMATFLPFYRSHCSNNVEYRTPWTYGEPYLSIIRSFLKLRYRLMPYLYTLAWESSQTGHPLVRPLFWEHPDQADLWGVDDAFYLGSALLICPVFEAGGRSRQVKPPPGHWYSFWDDQVITGGSALDIEAPLETLPVLVKAGSIVPMVEAQTLVLHLYPPMDGSVAQQLYSDAGDGYGESRLETWRVVRFPDGVEWFWEQQGDYPFSYSSVQLCIHGLEVHQVWIDGQEYQGGRGDRTVPQVILQQPFHQLFIKGQPLAGERC